MRVSLAPRRAILAAAILLASSAVALPHASAVAGTLLVGYAPGSAAPASLAAYGDITAADQALGFAELRTSDLGAAMEGLSRDPAVDFVEHDGAVHVTGVSSDSARWDSARWDSSRWDSSRWDSLTLDSSRWDSSRWDSSRWDSSRWDSSRWDSSRWDSSRWDSTRWDGSPMQADPLWKYQWGLLDMNVDYAWALDMGHMRKTVCVVDSGVDYTHPDLAPQMWSAADGSHGWNFLKGSNDPMDDAGHGTHMAGLAAAAIGNGIGTSGVANDRIMAVKVLDSKGIGGEGVLAQGIQWCADHGANVVSMSLSSDQDSRAVARAVAYAEGKGLLLVASIGNDDGCGCPAYPAAYGGVLSVGALDMTRHYASFSRPGAMVAAPGELIAGPYLGGGYALGTGTSQATAMAAGVALLAWDYAPGATAQTIAQKLVSTTQTAPDGSHEPDAAALLAALR